MAVNRNTKPNRPARMRLILGWIVQSGGCATTLVGRCGRCGQDATTYNLRGIGGRPVRYFVLAHADAATATSYSFEQVFGCCNYCNDEDKTARIGAHALHPFARPYFLTDTRADADATAAALGREDAALADSPEEVAARDSAATRLPL